MLEPKHEGVRRVLLVQSGALLLMPLLLGGLPIGITHGTVPGMLALLRLLRRMSARTPQPVRYEHES